MFSNKKGQCEAFTMYGGQVAAWLENRNLLSLSPSQGNLLNKDVITILQMEILSYFDLNAKNIKYYCIGYFAVNKK